MDRVAAKSPGDAPFATTDHFTASECLMIAQFPTTGVATVNSVIGNLFSWATVVGFPLLFCCSVVERRR
jgi:hypothetical protein